MMGYSLCAIIIPGSALIAALSVSIATTNTKTTSRFHPEVPKHGHHGRFTSGNWQ
jgi:hypothetical protein